MTSTIKADVLQDTSATHTINLSTGDSSIPGGIKIGGTASANLLDDYETGTWDCRLSTSTTSVTPVSGWTMSDGGTGYYVKIGRLVCCQFYHAWGATTSNTSPVYMYLPFPVNGAGNMWCGNAIEASYVNLPTGVNYVTVRPENGQQYASFKGCGDNINRIDMKFSDFGASSGGYVLGTFNYMTAS